MEGNYVSFHGLSLTHSAGLRALRKIQKHDLLGGSRAQMAAYPSLSEQCESCLRSEVEIQDVLPVLGLAGISSCSIRPGSSEREIVEKNSRAMVCRVA